MKNSELELPYGGNQYDCDYTIGEVKTISGESIFGIIWYSGGESWCWKTYEIALKNARLTAERIHIAKLTGKTKSGLNI